MPIRTIADAALRGLDLRLCCHACGRIGVVDPFPLLIKFPARGWAMDLVSARAHFTCQTCRSSAAVIVVPASRPKMLPEPDGSELGQLTTERIVAGLYHGLRSAKKRRVLPSKGAGSRW